MLPVMQTNLIHRIQLARLIPFCTGIYVAIVCLLFLFLDAANHVTEL
jgi:hypothetical protein